MELIEEQLLFPGAIFLTVFAILPSVIISFVLQKLISSERIKMNLPKLVLIVSLANSVLLVLVLGAAAMAILLNYDQFICFLTAFLVYAFGFLGISYFGMILCVTDGKIGKSVSKY